MTTQTETHPFEAEVREVLSLVIHSLYTHREIFLRELISNASDAIDKLRFEALTDDTLLAEGESLGIALEVDPEQRLLRIADNGIGMTREELIENLGSVASSGTRQFLAALAESKEAQRPELIGQFGVGFYSAFMVADQVTVETRRAGSEQGWRWQSRGDGEFSVEPAEGLSRGTLITLELREPGEEEPDFTRELTLREVVRRYSDFVEYPIQMEVERTQAKLDEEGKQIEGETETVCELETLNSQRPLWSRSKSEISEEEYHEFYRHLASDWNPPLETIHFKVEGTQEFTALLYLPGQRPSDLFDPQHNKSNLSLYVRRVLIQKECEELLPNWLRFVRGVVESNDLPLNVSRETLQDSPQVRPMRKRLVKKVLDTLEEMLGQDRERYEGFWQAFGPLLKEGIYFQSDGGERVAGMALFRSTHGEGWTTLAEYLERAEEGQQVIHVLTGPDLKTADASPHLEALRAQGREVILLVDPVDEWVLQRLTEYEGKRLVPADRGDDASADEGEREALEHKQEEFKDLLESLGDSLQDKVQAVRFSTRLKDSAAVLVAEEHGMSGHMERMLRRGGHDLPAAKRVLELNPEHALVRGLKKLSDVDASSPRIAQYGELLLGQALLAEGAVPEDPQAFTKLVTELMVEAIEG